jgi:hypothetical protein
MGVQQADVVGDIQLVDSVEGDDAPLQRSSESPGMPGHDAFTLTHSHAKDVDELGVVAEELPERVRVLRIQRSGESIDDLTRRTECRHPMTPD